MRELSLRECRVVAGGTYELPNYDDTDYQDTTPPPPPPPGGSSSGAPPVGTLLPWQAVLSDLSVFFDEIGGVAENHITGADQNSYYNDGSDTAPLDDWFLDQWGWLPSVQNDPGAHFYDYLTQDADPEFLLTTLGSDGFAANFASGVVATTVLAGGITEFTVNGITVTGTWHQSTDVPTDPNEIVVNGGYWSFELGPPALIPPGGSSPPSNGGATYTAPSDPLVAAHLEEAKLSVDLHTILNVNGGHLTVTFKTPTGMDGTFDLAEFVAILDHYDITATNIDYKPISGGVGLVEKLPNGNYQTQINFDGLRGYAAMYGGIDFLIIHELSHKLGIAESFTNSTFQQYITAGGTREGWTGNTGFNGAPGLYISESYVNNIYAAIAGVLGIPTTPRPGGGYDYSGTYVGH